MPNIVERGQPSLAEFDQGIELKQSETRIVDEQTMLVRLDWSSNSVIDEDLTTFVHLVTPDGKLAAQHDGIPGVGFRPTSSWAPGETVVDLHWIDIPSDINLEGYQTIVGLYKSATGVRIPLSSESSTGDAFQLANNRTTP